MKNNYIIAGVSVVFIIVVLLLTALAKRFKPTRLNINHFKKSWEEVQRLCGDKVTWPLAIINGDKLLDEALKKSHYKGKSMGERLVSAQRDLSDNEQVWHAHKLRNKLVHDENPPTLKKRQVMNIMISLRQALKDVGALR
jgi:hypothetical protein